MKRLVWTIGGTTGPSSGRPSWLRIRSGVMRSARPSHRTPQRGSRDLRRRMAGRSCRVPACSLGRETMHREGDAMLERLHREQDGLQRRGAAHRTYRLPFACARYACAAYPRKGGKARKGESRGRTAHLGRRGRGSTTRWSRRWRGRSGGGRCWTTGVHATLEDPGPGQGRRRDLCQPDLRLTLLAPEIVEAILDGRQPAELQLDDLLKGFPKDWEEQRRSLAINDG